MNTLVFEDGHITGSNTDGWGFLENLRAHGVDPAAGPALMLGAGGSARAIAAVLLDLGVRVTVANRTRDRAEALARELPGLTVIDWDRRDARSPTMRCWSTPPRWAWPGSRRWRSTSTEPRAA